MSVPLIHRRTPYLVLTIGIAVWLTVVIIAGFATGIPWLGSILGHSARNLYFHVTMWFTLMSATGVSAFHSLRYLMQGNLLSDIRAAEAARVGVVFGVLGLLTGIVWARFAGNLALLLALLAMRRELRFVRTSRPAAEMDEAARDRGARDRSNSTGKADEKIPAAPFERP